MNILLVLSLQLKKTERDEIGGRGVRGKRGDNVSLRDRQEGKQRDEKTLCYADRHADGNRFVEQYISMRPRHSCRNRANDVTNPLELVELSDFFDLWLFLIIII